jgi:hypothetical protein
MIEGHSDDSGSVDTETPCGCAEKGMLEFGSSRRTFLGRAGAFGVGLLGFTGALIRPGSALAYSRCQCVLLNFITYDCIEFCSCNVFGCECPPGNGAVWGVYNLIDCRNGSNCDCCFLYLVCINCCTA